jgi:hypothetical protein
MMTAVVALLILPGVGCSRPASSAKLPAVVVPSSSNPTTSAPSAQTTTTNAALTAADVSTVSGIAGVTEVPRDPSRGAGGDSNFADSNGKLILMVNYADAAAYGSFKQTLNYHGPVSGVGDAAFNGPAAKLNLPLYQLGVRSGDHAALLTTYFKGPGTKHGVVLSQPQLKALALIAISRWK